MIRVTTGVEAHTHEFIATAHDDQKFGLSLNSGAAAEAVRRILALPALELVGLHSHIGSQIVDTAGFEVAARRLATLLVQIKEEHGVVLPGARPRRRLRHRLRRGRRGPRHQGRSPTACARSSRKVCTDAGLPVPTPDRRARPHHRRARRHHPLRGRHRQGRRGAAHLRQRRRRHERQHPHRPLRRRVHRRAGQPREHRRADAQPRWSASTARAATWSCATATCPPTWLPAT